MGPVRRWSRGHPRAVAQGGLTVPACPLRSRSACVKATGFILHLSLVMLTARPSAWLREHGHLGSECYLCFNQQEISRGCYIVRVET